MKYLYRLLSYITFGKMKKRFKNKLKKEVNWNEICEHNFINIPNKDIVDLKVIGKNNKVEISENLPPDSKVKIYIHGENNSIKIDSSKFCVLNLIMGYEDDRTIRNASFICGNTLINEMSVLMIENNTSVHIGNGGMCSTGIEMRCTDDHAILFDGKVINKAKDIIVGDHVWIGKDVLILKNSNIPNGCVVGARSVVAKKFEKENSVLVGNPARIVKENISWEYTRPDLVEKEKSDVETIL